MYIYFELTMFWSFMWFCCSFSILTQSLTLGHYKEMDANYREELQWRFQSIDFHKICLYVCLCDHVCWETFLSSTCKAFIIRWMSVMGYWRHSGMIHGHLLAVCWILLAGGEWSIWGFHWTVRLQLCSKHIVEGIHRVDILNRIEAEIKKTELEADVWSGGCSTLEI